jgi:hypothetical protein
MKFLSLIVVGFLGFQASADLAKQTIRFDGQGNGLSTLTYKGNKFTKGPFHGFLINEGDIVNPINNLQNYPMMSYESSSFGVDMEGAPCKEDEVITDVKVTASECLFNGKPMKITDRQERGTFVCQASFVYGACKRYVTGVVLDHGDVHYRDAYGHEVDKDGNPIQPRQ